MSSNNNIEKKLEGYKRKYHLALLIKGALTTLLIFSCIYISTALIEYTFWLNSWLRGLMLLGLVTVLVFLAYRHIINPLLFFFKIRSSISSEQAAKLLGKKLPGISDSLLNYLQLINIKGNNSLVNASLYQRSSELDKYNFSDAIDLSKGLKSAQYLFIPLLLILGITWWSPELFKTSSERIINFRESYVPVAPFHFEITNENLETFENESFELKVKLIGESIPNEIYLIEGNRKIKMTGSTGGLFSYTFENLRNTKKFSFEGAGFFSKNYQLLVVPRPSLVEFNVLLQYPRYLKRNNTSFKNTGNLTVPSGTTITWQLKPNNCSVANFIFNNKENREIDIIDNQEVNYEMIVTEDLNYEIILSNEFGKNNELLQYSIQVIDDQYPTINTNVYQDTVLYSFVNIGGNLADDYGLTQLQLFYRNIDDPNFQSINIPLNTSESEQSFYYQWLLDSTLIGKDKTIEYYLQVWDNDILHGYKSSKTNTYQFKVPTKRLIKEKIKEGINDQQENIDRSLQEAKELKDRIEEAEERLKGKKELTWQDENLLKDIIKKKEELDEALEQLKEQNKLNELQKDRFSKQNERLAEKAQKLQELMDELLDEETKALYEELQKLLDEQQDIDQIQNLMNEIDFRENNLEKELERTLELFKKMKFEYEMNEVANELEELSNKQEELKSETEDKNSNTEELFNQQENINKEFNDIQEELEELNEMGQELKNPKDIPDQSELFQEIQKDIDKAKEELKNSKKRKAQESQDNAKKNLKKASDELKEMMNGMQMMMQQQNLDFLRDIVHNLLKLSFDQEALMNEFKEVDQSDPRFVALAQEQIKLMENSEIVKDSLESLANRVFQIQSFITREINEMNSHMEASSLAIKERKKNEAVSKQQFAMTSMNNLALLLDDVLQQMQQQMADAMESNGPPKPGDKNMPGLSELQQQLNQKIEQLKKSGKSGRQLSEELAKMAAEQERIRKALEEAQEKFQENMEDEMPGNGLAEKMEETEIDLVNKQITDETIKRQREILTRLLEAEDALRERELDEEREGEAAKEREKIVPRAFEEYFKMKEKEIELLKTVPPKLYPYYKNEVNDYFKRIGNTSTTQNEYDQN